LDKLPFSDKDYFEQRLDCQHLLGQLFLGQKCLVFNRTKIS
jgi:hypothetical protein